MNQAKVRWIGTLLAATCVFTILGFWGEYNWLLDLANHFRFQYVLLYTLVVLFLLLKRKWLPALCLLPFLLINFMQVAPYFQKPDNVADGDGTRIKILHLNLFANRNWNYAGVMRYIREVNPDLISIQEFEKEWPESLYALGLAEQYPYRIRNSQTALFSRLPLKTPEIIHTAKPAKYLDSVLTAKVMIGNNPVRVLVTHTLVPTNPGGFEKQRELFHQVVKLKTKSFLNDETVLIGDLNTTPWSANFKVLLEAGLRDTRLGHGVQPTWPIILPLVLIPIDHILVSERIQIHHYQTGWFIGSDHLPVIVELGLR